MATGMILECLRSGLVTSAGVAVASGKVRFYDVGTLTPATVYSDSAVSSAITQPLTLTAGGTGTVYLTKSVRMIAKDSTDTTTLFDDVVGGTVDDGAYVISASFNGGVETTLATILNAVDDSFGGTDWKYKHAATAAERNLKAWMGEVHVSVKDYGALGDDANDDGTAIQNAVNAAHSVAFGGGSAVVLFPSGRYRTSTAISIPSSGGVTLELRGTASSIIIGTNGSMNLITGSGSLELTQISLQHTSSSSGTAVLSSAGAVKIYRCVIEDFATGVSAALPSRIWHSNITAATDAVTGAAGTFILDEVFIGGGAVSSAALYPQLRADSNLATFAAGTADMANGGNATPTLGVSGQSIAAYRIRGTSAGSGTVNATATPSATKILVLDLFNNSGGAFTFTMNAQYHVSANPAPGNGSRIALLLVWDPTGGFWVQVGGQQAVT